MDFVFFYFVRYKDRINIIKIKLKRTEVCGKFDNNFLVISSQKGKIVLFLRLRCTEERILLFPPGGAYMVRLTE